MQNGTIKRLLSEPVFGWIAGEDGKEYFFHRSGLAAGSFHDFSEGDRVTFEEEVSEKGPRAAQVKAA